MSNKPTIEFAFTKPNYIWLIIGLAVNILGFVLMIGGASEDFSQFNEDELFSPLRITLAPILVVGGYIIMLYAIMKSSHKK